MIPSSRRRSLVVCLAFLALSLPSRGADQDGTAAEARFLSHTRQLIFEGRRSGEGYFSPDGKRLIFQSEREAENPFYQIYTLDLETGDILRISPGTGKATCAFFRPGRDEVLYSSTHLDPDALAKQKAELEFRASGKQRRYSWDYDEHMDIFLARRDGTNPRPLTRDLGYDAEASFSPDGQQIVFCSLRDAYPTNRLSARELKHLESDPSWFGEIYIMNADGSNVRRLTHTAGYDGGPFFSPDGRRIVWRRFTEKGDTADVFTMNLDGSDVERLTDFGVMSWAPYFHPSGRYIIFTANKLGFGNFELYLVDAAGTREPVRVTYTDGFDGLPVFSPDGRRLAWTSGRTPDGKSQIFIADWNHEAALAALEHAPLRQASAGAEAMGPATNAGSKSESARSTTELSTPPQIAEPSLSASITTNDLRDIVSYLAADQLEGRLSGSPGAAKAADYIAAQMQRLALKPVGTNDGYFQPYEFNAGARVLTNSNHFVITPTGGAPVEFAAEKDFRPLAFTANADVEGQVVFVGYGLTVPGKPGEAYDSYAGLDVSNRIALVLRYVPEQVDVKRRAELNRYAGVRYKAMHAREHGAKGVIFVTGPASPNAGELMKMSSDSSLSGSAIPIISASSNVVASLFAGSGQELSQLQAALDTENPHAMSGLVLTNVHVRLVAAVEHLRKTDRNVLGLLPSGQNAAAGATEYLLIGAHYDHLGHGDSGAMNRKGEEGLIHPGADDNASGVATLLELAATLRAERSRNSAGFPRGIIFAAWAGEELGLIGSSWFAEHPLVPLTNVVAYLNFDMVGRLRDDKLILQGVGSSPVWTKLIEKRNVAAGFNLSLQEDPYLPTDTTSLYPKGVPVLEFFTGSHEDYHRPTDKPDTLNYEGTARIARLARGLLIDLENVPRPAYAQVASKATGGGRETLRVYLGTIPDYAAEVQGVKLSGVRAGGPADKGGLKGGDIIVEFGGTKIANIYDYTYSLDAVKIGQPVSVVVLRNGQRVSLTLTPEARQ